jgi:hypothetical protein
MEAPTPPPCPKCAQPNAELLGRDEGFYASGTTTKTATIFVFACSCGASFTLTVPDEQGRYAHN